MRPGYGTIGAETMLYTLPILGCRYDHHNPCPARPILTGCRATRDSCLSDKRIMDMRDYIELGASPSGEDCAQLGSLTYNERMTVEIVELRRMMEQVHPAPDTCPSARYVRKSFQHDFGTYYELCACFDDNDASNDASIDWAFEAERCVPERWDATARQALAAILTIEEQAALYHK